MKPVRDWTRSDLEALIGQEEGSSLEFKASAALERHSKNTMELVKDVTALANAAGGVIIYGLVENKDTGAAEYIDDGSDAVPEWIEQILDSNAEPKVAGYHVQRIPLGNGRHAFAIDVPAATTFAPHQSKQHHQYFRRYGRRSLPMLDHEIRDLMRRGSTPDLYLDFTLTQTEGDTHYISANIGNRSNEPALYGRVVLSFDEDLQTPLQFEGFEVARTIMQYRGQHPGLAYVKNFAVPNDLPIFKEQIMGWFGAEIEVRPHTRYPISYRLACPGFVKLARGAIIRESAYAKLVWEGEPKRDRDYD